MTIYGDNYLYYNGEAASGYSVWHDHKISVNDTDWSKKSIFDPSPYGWVLPHGNIWTDFTAGKNTNRSKVTRGFPAPQTDHDLYYLPADAGDYSKDKRIFYPYNYYIQPGGGGGLGSNSCVDARQSITGGDTDGPHFENSGYISENKLYCFPARPVRYIKSPPSE